MAVDVAHLQIKIESLEADVARRRLNEFADSGKKAEKATDGLKSSLGGVRSLLGGVAAGLAALGLAGTIREVIAAADAWTRMNSQLRLVSTSTAAAARTMEELQGIAGRARVGLGATVELYAKLARSTQDLGASQAQVAQVTETISKALTISGASAASASGALTQLGQAFASGALRGDELNSVLEGTPRIAQAIADGMGITVGALRALGAEGKLTSDQIFNALLSQTDKIEAEFGKMSTTVEQALTQLGNEFLVFIGYLNESAGITSTLTGVIQELANQVRNLQTAMEASASAIRAANGDVEDMRVTVVSLADVMRVAFEAIIVTGANVAYVIEQFAAQIESAYIQASKFLSLDFKGAEEERQRHLQASDAARAGIDAFSESIVKNGRYLSENADSLARKAEMDRAAEAAAAKQWGTEEKGARVLAAVTGGTDKATKAKRELERAADDATRAEREFADAVQAAKDSLLTEWERAAKQATETLRTLIKGYDAGKVSADELAEANIRLSGSLKLVKAEIPEITGELKKFDAEIADGMVLADDWAGNLRMDLENITDEFYGTKYAIEDAFHAIRDNDWVGALLSILDAVKKVQEAFKNGATAAEKFAAVAGVVSGIGQAVGGQTGAGISGAASAATTAFTLSGGNPIITAIAAIAGGFLGSSQHEKQKDAQAQQNAINAYLKQLEAMNQRRELEYQLMELQGKAAEALALRRADELASMDAATAAIQAQIWALQDQAEAADKAAQAIAAANAVYDAAVASANGLVDTARAGLVEAYRTEASALKETIDAFTQLAKTLGDLGRSLAAQSASVASPLTAFRQSQGVFRSTVTSTDPNVLSDLPSASQAYLQAAMAIAPDKTTYQRVLAEVRNGVRDAERFATAQKSAAEQQLEELTKVVSGLVTINASVLSVRDAIAALAVAQAAAAAQIAAATAVRDAAVTAAQIPPANDNAATWTLAGYAAKNPDVAAWANTVIGQKGYDGQVISSYEQALQYHWLNHGKFEGRSFAMGTNFAPGGVSLVGERGPELVNLPRGSQVIPNSTLNRMTGSGDEETKALLRELIAETRATRQVTEKTERFWRGVTNDGRSINTAAAA